MTYEVVLDELIFKQNFQRIDPSNQRRIVRAIHEKLTSNPEGCGRPLSGPLKGFWKLRVGPYRILYKVLADRSLVDTVLVGFRRDEEAYVKAARRLGLLI